MENSSQLLTGRTEVSLQGLSFTLHQANVHQLKLETLTKLVLLLRYQTRVELLCFLWRTPRSLNRCGLQGFAHQQTSCLGHLKAHHCWFVRVQLQSASTHFITAKHVTPVQGHVDNITFRLVSYHFFSSCHVSVGFNFDLSMRNAKLNVPLGSELGTGHPLVTTETR